jgi:hypothetical protein
MDRRGSSCHRFTERSLILAMAFLTILAMSYTAVASSSSTAKPAALAVIPCRTTFATAQQAPRKRLPKSVTVDVPQQLASSLVVYSDTQEILTSVGPRGWACDATFGADGSGGLLIHPTHERVPLKTWGAGWALSPGSRDEAITAYETGGSPNQAAGEACQYFSAAAKKMVTDFGHRCAPRPKAEHMTSVNPRVVRFTDPPELHGGGVPSGGKNQAAGLLIYWPKSPAGTYRLTCTLPRTISSTCAVALDYFQTSR